MDDNLTIRIFFLSLLKFSQMYAKFNTSLIILIICNKEKFPLFT